MLADLNIIIKLRFLALNSSKKYQNRKPYLESRKIMNRYRVII